MTVSNDSASASHPLLAESTSPDPNAPEAVVRRRRLMRRLQKTELQWKQYCCSLLSCLHPLHILRRALRLLLHSTLLLVLLLCSIAWILYYNFHNPELDFMPGTATVSWWLNFLGTMLCRSRILQWFLSAHLIPLLCTAWPQHDNSSCWISPDSPSMF